MASAAFFPDISVHAASIAMVHACILETFRLPSKPLAFVNPMDGYNMGDQRLDPFSHICPGSQAIHLESHGCRASDSQQKSCCPPFPAVSSFSYLPIPAGNDALQTGDFLSKNSCHAPPPSHFGHAKETVHHLQTCTSQALKIYANLSVP